MTSSPGRRAELLREAFDRSFAEPLATESSSFEDLLAVGVGNHSFAFRLAEVKGMLVDVSVVALPSPASELLGIVGHRGSVVPVYSLRALIGEPTGEPGRFIVLLRAPSPVGLAFDRYDGHIRVTADALVPLEGADTRPHARELLHTTLGTRPVLSTASLLEQIGRCARSAQPDERSKER